MRRAGVPGRRSTPSPARARGSAVSRGAAGSGDTGSPHTSGRVDRCEWQLEGARGNVAVDHVCELRKAALVLREAIDGEPQEHRERV